MKPFSVSINGFLFSQNYPNGLSYFLYSRSLTDIVQVTTGDRKKPNVQQFTVTEKRNPTGSLRYQGGSLRTNWRDGVLGGVGNTNFTPMSSTGAFNSTLSSLTDSVRGGLDLSIDLAEIGKSKQMVVQTMKFVSYVREFKRQFRNLPVKALGGKWLELKYGWQPMLSSIYELGEKIMSTKTEDHEIVLHARGSSKQSSVYDDQPSAVKFRCEVQESVRHEIGITLSPKSNRLQALGGYTSLNPLSIAWELMPYSFVVDWFIDVGGYLRNAETALLYQNNFVTGYNTYTWRKSYVWTPYSIWTYEPGAFALTSGVKPGYFVMKKKNRAVLTSYPLPRFPVIEPHLGSSRLFSAASLLSQFLGRR